MHEADYPSVYNGALNRIDLLVGLDVPLEGLEMFCEDIPGLDEEERAALWLYAEQAQRKPVPVSVSTAPVPAPRMTHGGSLVFLFG